MAETAEAAVKHFLAAFNAGDAAMMREGLTDDAQFVNILGEWMKGADAVEAAHHEAFEGPLAGGALTAMTVSRHRDGDGWAMIDVDWSLEGAAGLPDSRGHLSFLCVREASGWLVTHGHNTRREVVEG